MRTIICDNCLTEIHENYYGFVIYKYIEESKIDDEEEHEFCSTKCMGQWMIDKAKESYGVYG